MSYDNPFAAPEEKSVPVSMTLEGDGVWRDGKLLMFEKDIALPPRCIYCNAPAETIRKRKKISWAGTGYSVLGVILFFLLRILGLIIYAVIYHFASKKATVDYALCELHDSRFRRLSLISYVTFFLSIVLIIGGIVASNDRGGQTKDLGLLVALVGGVVALTSIIVFIVRGNWFRVKKIDDRYAWLSHVRPDFLESLPHWTG